jgi:hypothetical protein
MKTELSLYVSKADIVKGQQRPAGMTRCGTCPISQALARKFPGQDVWTNITEAFVDGRKFTLGPAARTFQARVDAAYFFPGNETPKPQHIRLYEVTNG